MTTLQTCPTCGAGLDPDASGGLCPSCLLASALEPFDEPIDTTLAPGSTIGVFRIAGLLGTGGMATVYDAYDTTLERSIALKILPPEFLHDPAFARRFQREAKVIASLEHPNIVPIYASGIDEGIPWMSMRRLDGGSLDTLLEHSRPPVEGSLRILSRVADALDYAHARGIVHRDIKPTNILLDGTDHVCVADFGLAYIRDFNLPLSRSTIIAGTPHYMAPEHGLGKEIDHRADIYSLGVLAFEMLTGTLPFTAESPIAILLKHVNEPPPSPDGLSAPLLRVVHKALAKEPADRWGSAGAFVSALESALVEREASSRWRSASAFVGRRRLGLPTGAIAAILLISGVVFLQRQPGGPTAGDVALAPTAPSATAAMPAPDTTSAAILPASAPQRSADQLATSKLPAATPPAPSRDTSGLGVDPAAAPSSSTVDREEAPAPARSIPEPVREPTGARTPAVAPALTAEEPPPTASSDVITQPIRTRTVSPSYPAVARAANIVGEVGLRAVVGIDGTVTDVTIVRSVHPLLDDAARRAVLQYQYSPGLKNGVPQPTDVEITVSFRIE